MFQKMAFIGAGSITESIITGILGKKFLHPGQIHVTNRSNWDRLQEIHEQFHVHCSQNKREVIEGADVVLLLVKPKDVIDALASIKPFIHVDQLVLSVLAGVSTDYISDQLESEIPVVRAMPNTSAAVGFSATAIAKGRFAKEEHLEKARMLFQMIGTAVVVQEEDLHTVTGLSGSGPAYIYYFVEAMEEAAAETGLDADIAKELIIQTFVGAVEMLKTSKDHPSVLRKKITSPGGATQAGLEILEKYHYREALIECIKGGAERSIELGRPFKVRTKE